MKQGTLAFNLCFRSHGPHWPCYCVHEELAASAVLIRHLVEKPDALRLLCCAQVSNNKQQSCDTSSVKYLLQAVLWGCCLVSVTESSCCVSWPIKLYKFIPVNVALVNKYRNRGLYSFNKLVKDKQWLKCCSHNWGTWCRLVTAFPGSCDITVCVGHRIMW